MISLLTHICREANRAVDLLANHGVKQVEQEMVGSDMSIWTGLKETISKEQDIHDGQRLCHF